jgi:uncharacterized protein YbbC (DUF1343 family)
VCGGAQLHVTDPKVFRPVHTAVAILCAAKASAPDRFAWREPPYEYETEKAPIDILWGHDGLRRGIDSGHAPDAVLEGTIQQLESFEASVRPDLLYD